MTRDAFTFIQTSAPCYGSASCHHRGRAYVNPYPARFPWDPLRVRAVRGDRRLDAAREHGADGALAVAAFLAHVASLRVGARVTTPPVYSAWVPGEGTFLGFASDGRPVVAHGPAGEPEFQERMAWWSVWEVRSSA